MTSTTAIPAPSTEIRVAGLRQIFVWPLALDLPPPATADEERSSSDRVAAAMTKVSAAFSGHGDWGEVLDLLDHVAPPLDATHERNDDGLRPRSFVDPRRVEAEKDHARQSYAEFVYFYDFLQRMLFVDGRGVPCGDRPIRLWRHEKLREIEFVLYLPRGPNGEGLTTYRAFVDRLQVYLFDSGAAVIVLEVDFGSSPKATDDRNGEKTTRDLTLADTLTITDHLRRVYTPFFNDHGAARVPKSFAWYFADSSHAAGAAHPCSLGEDLAFVREGGEAKNRRRRHPPVADHWRRILEPLAFAGYGDGRGPRWRHVLDERIPLMSFVSLTEAARALGIGPGRNPKDPWDARSAEAQRRDFGLVGRGDWVRLGYADEAGRDAMPYNPDFLDAFEKTAYYDRFAAHPQTTSAARFLFAGYHFAVVGAGSFFDETLVHHFRRHYFQMMLLANLELASLLVTSSRISQAVSDLRASGGGSVGTHRHRRFIEELESINEWFLTFVHLFRFSGVSNQIQPSELYERMRVSMKLDPLFTEVKEELEAAVDFNSSCEERRLAISGERLSNVATIGAAVGLAFTFLGMNVVIDPLKAIYTPKGDGKSEGATELTPVVTSSPEAKTQALTEHPRFTATTPLQLGLADFALTCAVVALFAFLTQRGLGFLKRGGQPRRGGPTGVVSRSGEASELLTKINVFGFLLFIVFILSFYFFKNIGF